MIYASRFQLEERYGIDEIAQREQATSATAVQKALEDASALIDSYLVGRYETPLNPIPMRIEWAACVIARYNLIGEAQTERARLEYQDAIRWLELVANGKVQLAAGSQAQSNASVSEATFQSVKSIFTRGGQV